MNSKHPERDISQNDPAVWASTKEWKKSFHHTRRNLQTRIHRINYFDIPKDALILDYGCGDGLDLQAFASLGYNNVIGIDHSAQFARKIRTFPAVIGDVYSLVFADASVDVIFVNSVLHHLHLPTALPEINRILKPEGKFHFIEPRNSPFRKVLDWATLSLLAKLSATLLHRRRMLLDEWEEHYRWLAQEPKVKKTLLAAGFGNIQTQHDLVNMFVSCTKLEGAQEV